MIYFYYRGCFAPATIGRWRIASADCATQNATQPADQPDIAYPKLHFFRARRLSAALLASSKNQMKIEDKNGREIFGLDDWAKIYETPQSSHQWKKGRSAYSAAQFVLELEGVPAIQSRITGVIGEPIEIEKIVPELEVRFDEYGRGRVHDLGMFGRTQSGKSIFIGVEAKVDESFGASVLDSYLAAKSKQIAGVSTNAPERIEKLLSQHFKNPNPSMFEVRYQLLYATVGTLAVEADIHVLYVVVFKTLLYDESIGVENYRDYVQFMNKVGASTLKLKTKEVLGHKLNINERELLCLHEYFEL